MVVKISYYFKSYEFFVAITRTNHYYQNPQRDMVSWTYMSLTSWVFCFEHSGKLTYLCYLSASLVWYLASDKGKLAI
uniref:Uncharacterized protein n=1 Tax=Arundo donax TaxID=35708 RepID=A0A0A9ADJ6_ARUDO